MDTSTGSVCSHSISRKVEDKSTPPFKPDTKETGALHHRTQNITVSLGKNVKHFLAYFTLSRREKHYRRPSEVIKQNASFPSRVWTFSWNVQKPNVGKNSHFFNKPSRKSQADTSELDGQLIYAISHISDEQNILAGGHKRTKLD